MIDQRPLASKQLFTLASSLVLLVAELSLPSSGQLQPAGPKQGAHSIAARSPAAPLHRPGAGPSGGLPDYPADETEPAASSPGEPESPFKFPRLPDKEYLSHELSERACYADRGCQRRDLLNNTYLSYCSRYKLDTLLSNSILMSIMHDSSEQCANILDEFIQLDETINQFDQSFRKLLTRYNCHNGYSVKWNCEDCKRAYKDWLCATNLPYYMNGERIKPCISFCERVEQRCPYLHPITKEQYGGQPVFICRDPNIPFVPKITPDIPYSEPTKCYDMCHLSDNQTELTLDTLSKYNHTMCPDKDSIAEEVRSDSWYCSLKAEADEELAQANSSDQSPPQANGTHLGHGQQAEAHVHLRKLSELREVLAVYRSQPKTHRFGHHSDHRSLRTEMEQLAYRAS